MKDVVLVVARLMAVVIAEVVVVEGIVQVHVRAAVKVSAVDAVAHAKGHVTVAMAVSAVPIYVLADVVKDVQVSVRDARTSVQAVPDV